MTAYLEKLENVGEFDSCLGIDQKSGNCQGKDLVGENLIADMFGAIPVFISIVLA